MLRLKRFFILTVISLYAISLSAQTSKKKPDWEIDGLKGKVKSSTVENYKMVENNPPRKNIYGKTVRIYDAKGRITEIIRDAFYQSLVSITKDAELDYTLNGVYKQKCVFRYDTKGILVRQDIYNRDGILKEIWTYSYDAKGNLTKMDKYYGEIVIDLCKGRIAYKYDKKGNMTEKAVYGHDEVKKIYFLIDRDNYKFDAKNNLIERTYYNGLDKKIMSKDIYRYNSQGNKIVELNYDLNMKLSYTCIGKYDANGDRIEQDIFAGNNKKSPMYRDTFKYDANRNMIEQISMGPDFELMGKRTSNYDTRGNLTETKFFESRDQKNLPTIELNGETWIYEYYE